MLMPLHCHPDSRGGLDLELDVEAEWFPGGTLRLRYLLTGAVEGVRLPATGPSERRDELWRSTCFEAFLRRGGGGYYEFNFAPSAAWAAYRFEAYRSGMSPAGPLPPPRMKAISNLGCYDLRVELELGGLADLPHPIDRLHLTAVIETSAGETSYWATRHAPGKPDFHAFARPEPA
jgi:hypothetical protein